jgi:hypothetical protein
MAVMIAGSQFWLWRSKGEVRDLLVQRRRDKAVPMARPKHADNRYLELKNGKYRVTVAVPRALQGKLGTKLKRPLRGHPSPGVRVPSRGLSKRS